MTTAAYFFCHFIPRRIINQDAAERFSAMFDADLNLVMWTQMFHPSAVSVTILDKVAPLEKSTILCLNVCLWMNENINNLIIAPNHMISILDSISVS